ncbi:hypothetical protein E4413_13475 [Leptospira interrogans]|nr:hypothetical protein C5473_17450 [Leptospira interrogans serovar Weerasinghe]QCO41809.1 hypothetical protein E4413_13475 [Leptospira interrogans]
MNIRKFYIIIIENSYLQKILPIRFNEKKTKENYFSTTLFLVFKKLEISIFGKFFLIFLYY